MNSVILIGRLTRDPELRYTPNTQTAVAHFTLAIDRPAQSGQERQADFIRITVFGKQAETVDRYLSKGSQAAVSGRIQTGQYKDKNGQTVYTTDVIANRVEFLGSRNNGGGNNNNSNGNEGYRSAAPQQSAPAPQQDAFGGQDDFPDAFQAADDDIPF
ncbi:MAG: single-stranded DNA-binding protein [Eubacteriales bacterium]|nr:single-stranded DNA-binding protein [Eubacteriales bacterium]